MKNGYSLISLDRISDPEKPMRTDMTPESVADLVASIKQIGIIEPLIVTRRGDDFEIVAGHRRFFAATIAGLAQAPCLIKEIDGLELELMKLHENMGRSDVSALDWAVHLQYLKDEYEVSIEKLADMLGVSPGWVGQHLAILKYPDTLKQALRNGTIAFSAARELSQIQDEKKKEVYIHHAIKGGVTPGLAAQWRRQANQTPPAPYSETNSDEEQNRKLPEYIPYPICPVCNEEVPLEHNLTITIHDYCKPQTQES